MIKYHFSAHGTARICATLLFYFLCICSTPAAAQGLVNNLRDSPSPYLALHGDDPVAWQEWNSATLERARKENKLLYVSIGYFSCHWCHVMQAESYRNAEIAAVINRDYIPVKVDRELEVALDAELIAFAQRSLGTAGWPLNVFITPEGYPLYANLYEKPERFSLILHSLSKEWKADSAGLKAIAVRLVKEPEAKQKIKLSKALAVKYRKKLVAEMLEQADFMTGGLDVSRKFPISPQLSALLEIQSKFPDEKLAQWLRLTLDQMMNGGLRDHLAGGFFRYTVDPHWQVPHFEKMLYDNAQLAIIYLRASKLFKQPRYLEVARETLDFMLRDMSLDGAYITSISALDEQGREGGAYLWTEDQLKQLLDTEDLALLSKIWGMETAAEFEYGYLPMNRKTPADAEQSRLKVIYGKLLKARNKRVAPRDIKLLSGLNGLALEAFSEAAELAPRYRLAADTLHNFILEKLWLNGELQKGVSKQQPLGPGDLESYAFAASGLRHYANLINKKVDDKIARQMTSLAWDKFHTPSGFVLEQGIELAKPYYLTVVEDSPLPSPSAVLIKTSLQAGNQLLRAKATSALEEGDALQKHAMFWVATQVIALNRMFGSGNQP